MVKCFIEVFHRNANHERFEYICDSERDCFSRWYEFMNTLAEDCKNFNGIVDYAVFEVWTVDNFNFAQDKIRELNFRF